MTTRIVAFYVRFELPEGATVADAEDYIEAGLASERGSRPPADPMHEFNRDSINVKHRHNRFPRKDKIQ